MGIGGTFAASSSGGETPASTTASNASTQRGSKLASGFATQMRQDPVPVPPGPIRAIGDQGVINVRNRQNSAANGNIIPRQTEGIAVTIKPFMVLNNHRDNVFICADRFQNTPAVQGMRCNQSIFLFRQFSLFVKNRLGNGYFADIMEDPPQVKAIPAPVRPSPDSAPFAAPSRSRARNVRPSRVIWRLPHWPKR